MPCACKNKPPNVPENMEWGPVFWKLLHGLAEKAGSAPLPGLQGDETRAWKSLLTGLQKTLPCETCREHLASYVISHPITIPDNYSGLRGFVRQWVFDLHNDVNTRLGKPVFDIGLLSVTYGGIPLRETYKILEVLVKRSIMGTALPLLSWNNWTKSAKTLFGMYC
jgi:hypothetical protein